MRVKTSKRQARTGAGDPARLSRGHGIAAPILDGDDWDNFQERVLDDGYIAKERAKRQQDDPTRVEAEAIERRATEVARKQQNLMAELNLTEDADVAGRGSVWRRSAMGGNGARGMGPP